MITNNHQPFKPFTNVAGGGAVANPQYNFGGATNLNQVLFNQPQRISGTSQPTTQATNAPGTVGATASAPTASATGASGVNYSGATGVARPNPTPAQAAPVTAPLAANPAQPAPVSPAQPAQEAQPYRSLWDFAPAGTESLFGPRDYGSLNFGNVQDYIPQNWSPSPLHDFQVQQGNKSLSKQLSAKGLIGSGVEDELRNDIAMRAAAEESQRLMDMARDSYAANNQSKLEEYRTGVNETNNLRNLISNMMSTDFGTYKAITEGDKDRQMEKDRQNLDLFSRVLGFMETLNPMQYGFPATTEAAKMQANLGNQLSSIFMTPSGGGGGGGVPPLPPYQAPAASGGSAIRDGIGLAGSILPMIENIYRNWGNTTNA